MSTNLIKDENGFLMVLGWVIGSLFVLVIMIAYASYILSPIVTPLINATTTEHRDVSQTAVSRGYGGLALAAVGIPIALVFGFGVYLIITNRSYDQ